MKLFSRQKPATFREVARSHQSWPKIWRREWLGHYQDQGEVILDRTLPSLLYDACAGYPNSRAFNEWNGRHWEALSNDDFRILSENLALGLQTLDLARGDRVCFFMHSDTYFCIADMGCLLAGLVNVPIYLTHTPETIRYVLRHAQARALMVSDLKLLDQLIPALSELPQLRTVLVAEETDLPRTPPHLAEKGIQTLALSELMDRGKQRRGEAPDGASKLAAEIDPRDVATIIYTSGTTGEPKGVMLTHQNLTFNAMAAFSSLEGYQPGSAAVALSFLPLTHVFARMMQYGYLASGSSVYFSKPDLVAQHLADVRPTVFATVPRVIEKFYDRILDKGHSLEGFRKRLFDSALKAAQAYRLGEPEPSRARFRMRLIDRLVFSKWRGALGGRISFIISGGAALRPELVNVFAAAGVKILQGYGLTETSPVISFNRPALNRAGTVGVPLRGVEVALGEDGEILTRGPHVMKGYYRNPEETRGCIDKDGWFHTGDIGEFTNGGLLKITDRKKSLFKLSTGKFVIPQPFENRLLSDPLIDHVLVVGEGRPYACALIFPDFDAVMAWARRRGLPNSLKLEQILIRPELEEQVQELVESANLEVPAWATIKRFRFVPSSLTVENGLLTPTLKVRRKPVQDLFAAEIAALYDDPNSSTPRPKPITGTTA